MYSAAVMSRGNDNYEHCWLPISLRTRRRRVSFASGFAEETKMKLYTRIAIALTVLLAFTALAGAQSWTPLNNQPGASVGVMLQLRDGRVLVHEEQAGDSTAWHVLTPDATGSYINGTWSSGGHLPSNYSPWFFGSQVLLDGQTVVVEGGEYNFGSQVWTTLGARLTYSGSSFAWVANRPPSGWSQIGDAQSVILFDGRYMQASCCSPQTGSAFYTGPNTWSPSGNIVGFSNDEGAYTLLPSGKVLMVDAWSTVCSSSFSSELFDPTTDTWSCGPNTTAQLWDNSGHELGSANLTHTGKVFQVGGTNNTSVYDPVANSWSAGPTPPHGLTGYDSPGALEPNGKVLVMLGPPAFGSGCQMMEYSPSSNSLANTANPTNCPSDPSFVGHLFTLPTGQVMFTDLSGLVEVYTPATGVDANAKPTILASSTNLTHGTSNNILYGKQLNGIAQVNAYGDDYQGDINFPLVKLTNTSTGKVYFCLTHNESTHSIAPGVIMFTHFDIPSTMPPGVYNLQSIAGGISSNAIKVTVH